MKYAINQYMHVKYIKEKINMLYHMRKMRSFVLQRQCKSSKDMFNSNFVEYLAQNLFHLYFQATNIPFYIWVLSQVLSLSI